MSQKPLFIGMFYSSVDADGGVEIPERYVEKLYNKKSRAYETVIIFDQALKVYKPAGFKVYLRERRKQLEKMPEEKRERERKLLRVTASTMYSIECIEGRLQIPESVRQLAHLVPGKEAYVLGFADCFEIWDAEEFDIAFSRNLEEPFSETLSI